MINTLSKINFVKNRVGGREVNLNLDDVFEYTVFFRVPLTTFCQRFLNYWSPYNAYLKIPIYILLSGHKQWWKNQEKL